jgi:hypothetical protein
MKFNSISQVTQQIVQGDTVTINLTVTSRGSAFNLTGYTPKIVIKESVEDTSALVTRTGTVSSATAGTATITLTTSDTNQTAGTYVAEIKITDGTNVKTLTQFVLEIIQAVSTS